MVAEKTCKITVDLGNPALHKAVKILAIEKGVTLRDVVIEALKDWVSKQEDMEDLQAIEQAKDEPSRPLEELLEEIGEGELLSKGSQKRR